MIRAPLAKRLALLLFLAALVAAFFLLGLQRSLTLDSLKASREAFDELHAHYGLLLTLAYMAVYVLVTGLSLPGALALSLAGGALFGFWTGVVAVSFAGSLGATCACSAARYLFRDAVQRRFGHRLGRINQGMAEEGALYLFFLRLVPVFPFFVINLVMGLTSLRLRTFYWVSQLGMLPATLVFVNAGTQLATVERPWDILSPGVLASFALLGLFPLAVKKIMARVRPRLRHSASPCKSPDGDAQ